MAIADQAQLPGPGAVFLDHTAFFVPAIEPAAAALERCGFRLTPFTAQTNRGEHGPVPAGTGNRCAMLRRGYLEILTATADTPLAQQLRERVAHHVGLHLAAFSSADAAAEHRRLAEAGFETLPLVDMRRPVALPTGASEARFTIARIADGAMPEGRVQVLTHHTEAAVWREDYLDHPNGAEALTALWIAAADPAEAAARFARFTGRAVRQEGELTVVALDRGSIAIARPDVLRDVLGVSAKGPPPCFAAAEIAVADLGATSAFLASAGLSSRNARLPSGKAALVLDLPEAAGDALIFHQR